MDLKNKNIVYVGGVGGVGVEACKILMLKNIKCLVVLDICENQEALNAIKAANPKVSMHFLKFDLTMDLKNMRKKFAEIIAKIQRIDVLINGAGILDESAIELTVQTNVTGIINTIIAAMDHMSKRSGGPGGVILNITSKSGLTGFSAIPVYGATSAAIISFTSTLSQLKNVTGITAFVFSFGITRTNLTENMKTFLELDEGLSARVAKMDIMIPETVAKNLISTIEICRNGAIWLCHRNDLTAVKVPTYWDIPDGLLP